MMNFEDEVKKQIQNELEKMLESKSQKTEEEKWLEAFSSDANKGITNGDDDSDDEFKAWRDAFK